MRRRRLSKNDLVRARQMIEQAEVEAGQERQRGGHRHMSPLGLAVEFRQAAQSVLRRRVLAQARRAERARRARLGVR